ncbi:MAG: hypothetical protein AB1Z19_06490 [Eubacteriales bacterium]
MKEVIKWLLESEPYTAFRTRLDILDEPLDEPEVQQAKNELMAHPQVKALVDEILQWPGAAITNHKKADLLYHKLAFVADLGFTGDDLGLRAVLEKIKANRSDQGVPEMLCRFPVAFGGTGEDMWAWILCDTPRVLYSLIKMGFRDDGVDQALDALVKLSRENGWPCTASPKLGKFHGPGRRSDPCPYATLLMLETLAETDMINSPSAHAGTNALLDLWERSGETSPYLFKMGTDFRKLKAPFIWYDILHVADVLSRFEWVHHDARFVEMLDIIAAKADAEGKFTPESIWMAWKGWDFGQKKVPSSWLTFLVFRIMKRVGRL